VRKGVTAEVKNWGVSTEVVHEEVEDVRDRAGNEVMNEPSTKTANQDSANKKVVAVATVTAIPWKVW